MANVADDSGFPYEKLLDWPFLGFLILLLFGYFFRREIAERLAALSELSFGERAKITLGRKEVDAKDIGEALTSAFRELEARVEQLEAKQFEVGGVSDVAESDCQEEINLDIPKGLQDNLWGPVYKMLSSEYWYARYVDTLARNTQTSEQLMLKFLQSRPDVEVFKDGDRWAASLSSRSRSFGGPKAG